MTSAPSVPNMPTTTPPVRFSRRELGLVVLFFTCLTVIFLAKPILNLGTSLYTAVDIGQLSPITQLGGAPVENSLMSDVYDNSAPWQLYNRELIRLGKLPVWNPYNAAGVPHLANYQSAVFSPFTLPLYLLPLSLGYVVRAFLIFFCAGFSMYLFLRGAGLRLVPALMAGVAFMFCGYQVVWSDWMIASASVLIPGCLFCLDQIIQRASQKRPIHFYVIGLFLCQLTCLLAGHPETMLAGVLISGAFAGYRLFTVWRKMAVQGWLRIAGMLIAVELLALGTAAIQVAPFVEYVANSATDTRGLFGDAVFQSSNLPLLIYPNLLGSPADNANQQTIDMTASIGSNYNELNNYHVAVPCVFLALIGVFVVNHRQTNGRYLFFLALVGLYVVYVFGWFGIRDLLKLVPGSSHIAFSRLVSIYDIGIVTCAAYALDALLARQHDLQDALVVALTGLGLLGSMAFDANLLLQKVVPFTTPFPIDRIVRYGSNVGLYFAGITLLFGGAVLLTAWVCITKNARVRQGMAVCLLGIVFLQSGWQFKDYNPTVSNMLLYPDTAATQAIRANLAAGGRLLATEGWTLWPDRNMVYHIASASNYDAITPRYYSRLNQAFFGGAPSLLLANHFDEAGLRLFGIQVIDQDIPDAAQITAAPPYHIIKQDYGYALLGYDNAVPAYRVIHNATVAATDDQAFALVRDSSFDPAQSVILNAAPDLSPGSSTGPTNHETVTIVSDDATQLVIDLPNNAAAGYLVLNKLYYPGWNATVDGSAAPVYRANYAFSAIPVSPGAHRVVFYYSADTVKLGAFVSLISLIIALGGLVLLRRRDRLAPPDGSNITG